MATIQQFTQYLFGLNHQANAARLALFNYLRNHHEGPQTLSEAVINRFMKRCLCHNQWLEKKDMLSSELFTLLENFNYRRERETGQTEIELSSIFNPRQIQIFQIHNPREFSRVVERHLEKNHPVTKKRKIIMDTQGSAIALLGDDSSNIELSYFENFFMLSDGLITPLCHDLGLTYSPKLLLQPKAIHHIPIAPGATARFTVSEDSLRLSGCLIRDFTFQKYEVFTSQEIRACQRVYTAIRRLEHYFISPEGDSYYCDLISEFDRSITLLQKRHPDGLLSAKKTIDKAKSALNSLYPSDKTLPVLVKDLDSLISSIYSPKLERN